MPTRSYLSQVEPVLTFGLGQAERIETLRVIWPDGTEQDVPPPDVDQLITIRQGEGSPLAMMNLAKAAIEDNRHGDAIELLRQVLAADPDSAPAQRNLARAYIASNQLDAAVDVLNTLLDRQPDSASAHYLLGITLARQTRFPQAAEHLEHAARLDPHTAAVRYQLALAYESLDRQDDALEQLRQTVRLDPLHAAAHYNLARRARAAGDEEAGREHLAQFERLRQVLGELANNPIALEACVHTQAEAPRVDPGRFAPAEAGIDVRFEPGGEAEGDAPGLEIAALAVIDMDDQGRYTFIAVTVGGDMHLLKMDDAGGFATTALDEAAPELGGDVRCIVANYKDTFTPGQLQLSRFSDVLLISPQGCRLFERTAPSTLVDRTEEAGLADVRGAAARWLDYDHDGDPDLLVAAPQRLRLYQHDGTGRFTEVTDEAGIDVSGQAAALACVDLDATNLGTDIIAAIVDAPTHVLMNQRAGRFAPLGEPVGPWPAATQVLADDVDNDGYPDVVLVGGDGIVLRYGRGDPVTLSGDGATYTHAVLIDYDNDGWLDLIAAGRAADAPEGARLFAWRNAGREMWVDVSEELFAGGPTAGRAWAWRGGGVRRMVAADAEGDGDTDLLVLGDDGRLHVLRNEGGDANRQLKLRLLSFVGSRSAVGTRVEVRRGPARIARWLDGELPIEIGVGDRRRLDSIQSLWPNGVIHNRTLVAVTDAPESIVILQYTQTSSCPFLYAWDGQAYAFVTDLLGAAPLNVALARGMQVTPNPLEKVILEPGRLQPDDDVYRVLVSNEMREATYVESLRLLAVDHPAGAAVHSTDKLTPPPFGPSGVMCLSSPQEPVRAVGDDGVDRTEALREVDGVFAEPGVALPPPVRGMCEPWSLEMSFASVDRDRPIALALTGWLQFAESSANIAFSQRPRPQVIWPTLEVLNESGQWRPVDVTVGLPAGKTKTIVTDLTGKLPPGSGPVTLRLTTTFEVRWDGAALCERLPDDRFTIRELPAADADLHWHGFAPMRIEAPGHPATPDPAQRSDLPPWLTSLEGWYTRYGDVRELTASRDGRYAILNGGDAIEVRFAGDALPAPAEGMRRSFVLETVGWIREGDPNAPHSTRATPLGPEVLGEEADASWQSQYNTRWAPREPWRR